MKNIFEIFKRDIKNITKNWVALVVVCGLIILPSLYAWFNIGASWDPYGNTKGIKVAIVNEDKGDVLNEEQINIGDKLIQELKENESLGWEFVSKENGQRGVESGKYYATIIIPEDFTSKTLSLVDKTLQRPEITYIVNEKSNAIAPKITDKGVSTIKEQIDSSIVESVNGILFKVLNETGIGIENIKPRLLQVIDSVIKIDDKMPEIENLINEAYDVTQKTEQIIKNINDNIPLLEETLNSTEGILTSTQGHLEKTKEVLKEISPTIKNDLIFINEGLTTVDTLLSDLKSIDKDAVLGGLDRISIKITDAQDRVNSMINVLEPLSKFNEKIKNLITSLNDLNLKLDEIKTSIGDVKTSVENGNIGANVKIQELKDLVSRTNATVKNIVDNYDSVYVPYIDNAINEMTKVVDNSIVLITNAKQEMPGVQEVLKKINSGAELGSNELAILKEELPSLKEKISNMASKLRGLKEDEQIDKLVDLIKNDYKGESEFLASPVKVKEEKLFPIPNYGSAMAPFYTVLAQWVGVLILISLLTVDANPLKDNNELKPYEKYFGKYLTFAFIAICQALVVTLGNLFLLKTYALNPALLVGVGVLTSVVFTMIIYTLVSIFGNVGKAIAVILLVLQVAASGGTFPIEVTSKFFQSINPMLPFTYAIGAMREAVAGVVPALLIKDISMLLIYFVGAVIIGLTLKGPINKSTKKLIDKLKESGLVGH